MLFNLFYSSLVIIKVKQIVTIPTLNLSSHGCCIHGFLFLFPYSMMFTCCYITVEKNVSFCSWSVLNYIYIYIFFWVWLLTHFIILLGWRLLQARWYVLHITACC